MVISIQNFFHYHKCWFTIDSLKCQEKSSRINLLNVFNIYATRIPPAMFDIPPMNTYLRYMYKFHLIVINKDIAKNDNLECILFYFVRRNPMAKYLFWCSKNKLSIKKWS